MSETTNNIHPISTKSSHNNINNPTSNNMKNLLSIDYSNPNDRLDR